MKRRWIILGAVAVLLAAAAGAWLWITRPLPVLDGRHLARAIWTRAGERHVPHLWRREEL